MHVQSALQYNNAKNCYWVAHVRVSYNACSPSDEMSCEQQQAHVHAGRAMSPDTQDR